MPCKSFTLEHLGKVTLYQTELRSLPNKRGKITAMNRNCKPCFMATKDARTRRLLEVINNDLLAHRFENLVHELQMKRVRLIMVLRLLAVEHDIESNLIRLIHDRPMAGRHFANVKMRDARNRREVPFRAGNQLIRRFGISRVGPENHHVGKHGRSVNRET